MLLNEITPTTASSVARAALVVAEFMKMGADAPNQMMNWAIKTLMTKFPDCVYKGTMRRVMLFRPSNLEIIDVRLLLAKMHEYENLMKGERKFYSWTTLDNPNVMNNLAIVPGKHSLFLCLEQDHYGLDLIKALKKVENMLGEDDVNHWQYELEELEYVINTYAKEREVVAQISNNIHVSGAYFRGEFYDLEHLQAAFVRYRDEMKELGRSNVRKNYIWD